MGDGNMPRYVSLNDTHFSHHDRFGEHALHLEPIGYVPRLSNCQLHLPFPDILPPEMLIAQNNYVWCPPPAHKDKAFYVIMREKHAISG